MRQSKEEPSCSGAEAQVIDLVSAVKELNKLSSQELGKLLKDSEDFTIHYLSEKDIQIKIDIEKLAGFLPLHLMAVLMSSDRDEVLFSYVLCGIRLLHSLCDLAPRHAKLEQILLDDVKVSEQLLDLVFYLLIILGAYRQEHYKSSSISLLHSTLVACSFYLLTGCLSSQWQDLVHILLAHPKVHIFMDAAFRVVHEAIRFLGMKLSADATDSSCTTINAEQVVNYLCLQCEASLQFLQTLCQQKAFRERLLRNKELCGKGGILFLARSILKLTITQPLIQSSRVGAAVSRLKAKVLSILLSLCEAESTSYLDEVASSVRSLDLAKSVALQVLELLKTAFSRDPKILTACLDKSYPTGFLQLNAMRLADIFSDDSNFRSYITINFTKVLTAIFSLSHGDFISSWCSSDLPGREEDAILEYDPFAAAGWILDNFSSSDMPNPKDLEFPFLPNPMLSSTYAHRRTSLFVKVIANLHCFVPNICEEQERTLFLRTFVDSLKMDRFKELPGYSFTSDTPRAANVRRNLRSLLSQAESLLIPNGLNEEDVQLLRVFSDQLQKVVTSDEVELRIEDDAIEESISRDKFSKLKISNNQEAQSAERFLSSVPRESLNVNNRNGNLKEGVSENSAFHELEFYIESDQVDQGDGLTGQHRSKDEGISGRMASEGLKDERDGQNVETSDSDTNSARGNGNVDQMGKGEFSRGKNAVDQINEGVFSKSSERSKESRLGGNAEDEKVETVHPEEKHRRKRKRSVMNDKQVAVMERALLDEPDMQRNAASIQSWVDKLSLHGSEVTTSQLKNWLNNRKARLARTAKDALATAEADNNILLDKQGDPQAGSSDALDSPAEDARVISNTGRDRKSMSRTGTGDNNNNSKTVLANFVDIGPDKFVQCKPGQYAMLVDSLGEEVAKGMLHQVSGKWHERDLGELEAYVVDVNELKAERGTKLPYPSDATGTSFHEAETKMGVMRVLWDSNKIFILQ